MGSYSREALIKKEINQYDVSCVRYIYCIYDVT